MKQLQIGIVQQHNTADTADNMHRLASSIEMLSHQGAQLVVLQELHNSLYFCQTEDVAPKKHSGGFAFVRVLPLLLALYKLT